MVDNRLISFIRIVETGSYTKAAEQLSLSQPAVSQHIRQLEKELGVRLFERSHNRLRLTPEGESVLRFARRVTALYSHLEQTLENERGQLRSLTVGITHTAESSVIIEALAAYVSKFEGLNLKILTNTTDNLFAMLQNYELDFAFVDGKGSDDNLAYVPLGTDCLVLAVAPGHRLAGQSTVTVDQLRQEKLILRLPNSNTRDLFNAALESQNLRLEDFNVTMEIESVASIKDLIRRDFGVSVLAKSACMDEYKKGKLAVLEIENMSMMREISIACPLTFEHPEILRGIAEKYNELQEK